MFDDVQDDAVEEALVETPAPSKKKCCAGVRPSCMGCGKCKMMRELRDQYGEFPWAY